ncbi:MAG: 2-amino-4-hydroxy-6-hydroxymethyldihydropteridine diphosphokinase [Caulobacteraceae bacterium]
MTLDPNAPDLAVIALGGNLRGIYPSMELALAAAAGRLPEAGFHVLMISRWWRSAAWPDPDDPPFLNGVVLAQTDLEPEAALRGLHRIEAAFGRDRKAPNAPRTLDLDLIALGRSVLEGPSIILPHPRAAERLFVMGPLAEIAPGWRHPVTGATAEELASSATIGQDAAPQ